ncbi:MAG: Na+-transporting NADH:ubiquinone oxidoreductase subunit C [Limisphaerales bacterium]
MDRESNAYTIGYAVVMTVIVAVGLALVSGSLKPMQDRNQQLATMQDILKAVGINDASAEEAEVLFNERIEGLVLNADMSLSTDTVTAVDIDMSRESKLEKDLQRYPLFVYNFDGETSFIIPLYGNGLWDKIWGYVAIADDFNTVVGISMDHKAETPALGAEIKDNPKLYSDPFIGKTLLNSAGEYVSISMKKGKIKFPNHQIDAITGATITSNGVNDMLFEDVEAYLPYFEQLKSKF